MNWILLQLRRHQAKKKLRKESIISTEIPRRVRIASNLDSNWKEVLDDVTMKAIPIKYISSVELFLSNNTNWTIDVAAKLNDEWGTGDESTQKLEMMIQEIHDKHGIELIEYMLDFDMIRSEVSFTSARLGNDNNSNSNLH